MSELEPRSYARYGIGCAVVWAAILAAAQRRADPVTREKVTIVCGGWWMGFTSASIARLGTAPPKPLTAAAEKRLQRGSLALVAIGLGNVARAVRSGWDGHGRSARSAWPGRA